jgi:hypothetical protein
MKKLLLVVAALMMVSSAQAVATAANAAQFGPFLYFSDWDGGVNGAYQGHGWVNHKFLVDCHKIVGEEKLTVCTISDTVEVRDIPPRGRIIAGLSKGTDVFVGERRGAWVHIDTACSERSIIPGSVLDANHTDAYLFSCPEKPQ